MASISDRFGASCSDPAADLDLDQGGHRGTGVESSAAGREQLFARPDPFRDFSVPHG
jgi:hypothetical protein